MAKMRRSKRLILKGTIKAKREDVIFKPSLFSHEDRPGIVFTIFTDDGPMDLWMGEEYFEFDVGDVVYLTDSHGNGKITMVKLIVNDSPVRSL